jgi:RNA polymerase sigma factor (sigma-70 family)
MVVESYHVNKTYIDTIFKYKNLRDLDESKLFERYRNGCTESRDAIVHGTLKLALSRAMAFRKTLPGLDIEELIQEASCGILQALDTFDPTKACFVTYANYYINMKLYNYMKKYARPIRLPSYICENLSKLNGAKRAFEAIHGRVPTMDEMETLTGMKKKKILEFYEADKLSWNASLTIIDGDGVEKTRDIEDSDGNQLDSLLYGELPKRIRMALSKLSETERKVLLLRTSGINCRKISDHLKISEAKIYVIRDQAIAKMKNYYSL